MISKKQFAMETKLKSRSLQVTFKPGVKQSCRANNYFVSIGNEMVDLFLRRLTPRQYRITEPTGDFMPLRIWSDEVLLDEHNKEDFIGWINQLMKDISTISSDKWGLSELREIIERWSQPEEPMSNYFIEHMKQSHGVPLWNYQPKQSFIVLGGRVSMVSDKKLMFIQIDEGMSGMSIIGKGSYLFETG